MATKKKAATELPTEPDDFNQPAFRAVQRAAEGRSSAVAQKRPAASVTREPDRRGIMGKPKG